MVISSLLQLLRFARFFLILARPILGRFLEISNYLAVCLLLDLQLFLIVCDELLEGRSFLKHELLPTVFVLLAASAQGLSRLFLLLEFSCGFDSRPLQLQIALPQSFCLFLVFLGSISESLPCLCKLIFQLLHLYAKSFLLCPQTVQYSHLSFNLFHLFQQYSLIGQ